MAKLKAQLPKKIYKSPKATIEEGGKLNVERERREARRLRRAIERRNGDHQMLGTAYRAE